MIANWLIGVLLACVASIVSNLGLNLQKLNHTLNEQRIRQKLRDERRRLSIAAVTSGNNSTNVTPQPAASPSSIPTTTTTQVKVSDTGKEYGTTGNRILQSQASPPSTSTTTSSAPSKSIYAPELTRTQRMVHSVFPNSEPTMTTNTKTNSAASSFNTKPAFPSVIPPKELDQQQLSQQQQNTSSTPTFRSSTPSHQQSIDAYDQLNSVNYSRQTMWRVGFIMVALGSVLDFVALIFAAQSIIAPLGSLTLVSNTLLAPLLLGESVSLRDMLATGAIVFGSALAIGFADHSDAIYTMDELIDFFQTERFIIYMSIVAVSILVLLYWKRHLTTIRRTSPRRYSSENLASYHRFTYAALSGIIGAQSVLFAKCVGVIVVTSFNSNNSGTQAYQTYLILGGLILSIYYQIKFLNSGLRLFESLYIVPVFQSFWILVSVVGGLIFFGEYEHVFNKPASSICFPLGVVITIGGVYVLSQRGGEGNAERHHAIVHHTTGSGRTTPQQRNFKHYVKKEHLATTTNGAADATTSTIASGAVPHHYDAYQAGCDSSPSYATDSPPCPVDVMSSSASSDDDADYGADILLPITASPAPPLAFMSGPFISSRYTLPPPSEPLNAEYQVIDDWDVEEARQATADRRFNAHHLPPLHSALTPGSAPLAARHSHAHHHHPVTQQQPPRDAIDEDDIVDDGTALSLMTTAAPPSTKESNDKQKKNGKR